MFAACFQRRSEAQHFGLGESVHRQHLGEPGFAFSEGAGLVHREHVEPGEFLDGLGVADEHTICAPRPMPIITLIGVASPRAQGHAMVKTATALVIALEDSILKNLRTFVGFARQRIGDAHLAEDVVQESLVKALAAGRKPAGEEDTVAWFYRILRRTIIDLYRRNDARSRALDRFERELPQAPTDDDERLRCRCFKRLLPAVPEPYRELLQQIDLEGKERRRSRRRWVSPRTT